jgi:hypothetical protein
MIADQLRAAGEALYGPNWQSQLARDLSVSDRTVRRWLAGGKHSIPARLDEEIAILIRARIYKLEKLVA